MKKSLSSLLSPAKLNLFFRVLRKRSDGYHEIASLFQAVNLFDRLTFSFSTEDALSCTDPSIPCDERNLIFKALALFRSFSPLPKVKIHLEKKIPIQAGLGGGSSNAATALWGFNELAGSPFSEERLKQMASQIGSDVPFFFSSGSAYCTGRGELLRDWSLPEPISGYVAKPFFGLSTPLVYGQLRLAECSPLDPQEALRSFPSFFNDLESAAFRLEPRLKKIKEELQNSFEIVVMTGSGSSFFCLQGKPASLDAVHFIPFHSISRKKQDWYQ